MFWANYLHIAGLRKSRLCTCQKEKRGEKENIFLFCFEREEPLERKGREREDTDFAQYSRKQETHSTQGSMETSHSTEGSMEKSLMSESVVDAADVEETVTRVLTHFVQGGDEQTEMSVELLRGHSRSKGTLKEAWKHH
jgi:hypothetical protein